MSETTTTPKIDPEAQYRVRLARRVELFGTIHYPGDEGLTLRGDVLASLAPEDVAHVEAV